MGQGLNFVVGFKWLIFFRLIRWLFQLMVMVVMCLNDVSGLFWLVVMMFGNCSGCCGQGSQLFFCSMFCVGQFDGNCVLRLVGVVSSVLWILCVCCFVQCMVIIMFVLCVIRIIGLLMVVMVLFNVVICVVQFSWLIFSGGIDVVLWFVVWSLVLSNVCQCLVMWLCRLGIMRMVGEVLDNVMMKCYEEKMRRLFFLNVDWGDGGACFLRCFWVLVVQNLWWMLMVVLSMLVLLVFRLQLVVLRFIVVWLSVRFVLCVQVVVRYRLVCLESVQLVMNVICYGLVCVDGVLLMVLIFWYEYLSESIMVFVV